MGVRMCVLLTGLGKFSMRDGGGAWWELSFSCFLFVCVHATCYVLLSRAHITILKVNVFFFHIDV